MLDVTKCLKHMRAIKTFNLYMSAVVSGMAMAITGPTLLDLQNIVNTDTKHIAFVYTARSSGYLFGSLIGGAVFDMVLRKQFLMTTFNLLVGVSLFAIPWSRAIGVLTTWMVVNGVSMGAMDTGLNVCCLNLWGKDSGPYYQALHFTYGFGGLVAPLIAAPFLQSREAIRPLSLNDTTFTLNQTLSASSLGNISHNLNHLSSKSSIPSITYGYAILGGFSLLVTALFFVVCLIAPIDENAKPDQKTEIKNRSRIFVATVVILTFLFLLVETGTEIGYAQMVATYAVKGSLKLTPIVASYITSAFWAAFTLSRFITIFLAIKFSSLAIIVFDLILTAIGAVILQFVVGSEEWPLWVSTVFLGVGIASLWPTAITWIEEYITINNKIVGLFATGGAFGEMVIPYTISYFIEEIPEVLSYVVSASCVLSTLLAFIIYLILRNKENKYITKEGIANAACNVNDA